MQTSSQPKMIALKISPRIITLLIEKRDLLIFSALLFLCPIIYWKGLSGPFILDDHINIIYAFSDNYSFDSFTEIVFNNHSGLLGRPISMASLFFSGWMHGVSPWGFKLDNLFTHIAISILVFLLIKLVSEQANTIKPLPFQLALFATAIWMLMPLHVSTVLYPVQRMAQLSTLFILLAMIVYIHAVLSPSIKQKITLYFVALPSACMLAIFSKENGALILPLLAILAVFFRDKMTKTDKLFAVFCVTIPILITIATIVIYFEKLTNYNARSFTLSERLLTEIDVIWHYLYTIYIPDIRKMSLVLDDFPIRKSIDLIWITKASALAAIVMGGSILLFKRSIAGFGITVFFIGHLLESTFIPLEIAFEHRNYFPSVGTATILTALFFGIDERFKTKHIKSIYLTALVIALYCRVDTWSSEDKLYITQLENRPFSKRAETVYANYLFVSGLYQQALNQAARGKEVHPNYAGFYLMEIQMISQLQAFDENLITEAVERLKKNQVNGYELQTLTALSSCKLDNFCNYLSLSQLHKLVDQAVATSKMKGGSYLGYLELIKARMHYKEKHFDLMETRYLDAYKHSSDPVMIIEMIGALWNSGQQQKAKDYLQQVEQGKYFSVLTNKKRINKLKNVIK